MAIKTIKQKFVIDESGSMAGQQTTIISGFNEQLSTMRQEEKDTDVRYLVTLTKFSDKAVVVFKDKPLSEVPDLTTRTYTPSGWTALYDAIGMTIDTAEQGETDVMVTIMTDGAENKSREWKKASIKTLIQIRENENKWGFVFFGANQDAWQEASQLNISNALNYTMANTGAAMKSMSAVRSAYVTSALQGTYTTSNLTACVNTDDLVK
jgi:uncharacterized protein YegL